MAITSITPDSTTNKVYGWLREPQAMRLVTGDTSFATIMAAFMKADDNVIIKERKYLNEAVQDNAEGNILKGLEKCAAITVGTLSASIADTSLDAEQTEQIIPSGDNGVTVKYKSSDPAVATVSVTGLVTGVATGAATITIYTEEDLDYFGQSTTIDVTVS